MDQNETPLFDALIEYKKNQKYSFHVPGHKDGLTFFEKGIDLYQSILSIDGTEVMGLDDLYEPTEAILEAQNLLKDLYGTVKSYFLVNGSTVGNLVMVLSVSRPGDKVLVQKNSHKSVFNALKLARVKPVFISPDVGGETLISTGIKKRDFLQAIEEHPDAKALILTYPNYYGMAKKDYAEIIKLAKQRGIIVLVDEAHGAHFILESPVPQSTLKMGADMVVHSAHKTLPAMTMGSYLHVNSDQISINAVEEALERLQTSSPSYPIMASLDLARAYLASIDRVKLLGIINEVNRFKKRLTEIGIDIIDEIEDHDPFKIILSAKRGGFELQGFLQKAGLFPEMADPHHVLFTLPLGGRFPFEKIMPALEKALKEYSNRHDEKPIPVYHAPEPLSVLALSYEETELLEKESVSVKDAAGRVAAQMVVPYPPGIPLFVDGEMILKDHVEQIQMLQDAGARFHGLKSDDIISVYKTKQRSNCE